MVETEDNKRLDITLSWSFFFIIFEIILMWSVASQFSYLLNVIGDPTGYFVFIVFGVILIATFLALTIAFVSMRATERWGTDRCERFLGINARVLHKPEVLILSSIALGTLISTGVWDIITVCNALVENAWSLSVFADDYLVMDLVLFQIIWPLWLHFAVGSFKILLGMVLGFFMGGKIKRGKFCEI